MREAHAPLVSRRGVGAVCEAGQDDVVALLEGRHAKSGLGLLRCAKPRVHRRGGAGVCKATQRLVEIEPAEKRARPLYLDGLNGAMREPKRALHVLGAGMGRVSE